MFSFCTVSLTFCKIIFNFEGDKRVMGRYPLDKTLMACEYYLNWLRNLSYIFTYFSLTVVRNSSELTA